MGQHPHCGNGGKKTGIKTNLHNDANACALAEWKFGAGKGTKNMVFLTFGTGLGAGLILNGKLYTGTNDNAGELGHIRLSDFGPIGYGKRALLRDLPAVEVLLNSPKCM